MKETPILFRGDLVRAILEGRKTMMRRPIKFATKKAAQTFKKHDITYWMECPYGQPGDRLWVRETWTLGAGSWEKSKHHPTVEKPRGIFKPILYRANGLGNDADHKWRPSIHMPKWACRLWLEIVSVRVERIQDISVHDVECEGFIFTGGLNGEPPEKPMRFSDSWNSTYPGSWDRNDWVWVIEFKKIEEKETCQK